MHFSSLLSALSAATLVCAGPIINEKRGTTVNANFDGLTPDPLTPLIDAPPSPYKGLTYSGFSVQTDTLNVLPANLKTHSPPNSAFFSQLTQVADMDTAQISVSKGYFNLKSLYAGCSTNAGASRDPGECTIVASQLNKDGVRHSTTFKLQAQQDMQKVDFPKQFYFSKQVSFVLTGETVQDATLTASFDNIVYDLFE